MNYFVKFETIEMPDVVDKETDTGVDYVYGLNIHTTLGVCKIEMRNDGGNGGYYGGNFHFRYFEPNE